MNEIQPSSEVDIFQFIETIWEGKWKIIAVTAACLVVSISFLSIRPEPNFVATTEIKPLLAVDTVNYQQSNALEFFAVYREQPSVRDGHSDQDQDRDIAGVVYPSAFLDQLFIEQLGSLRLQSRILKKNGFLLRKDFKSDIEYERALTQLAATISVRQDDAQQAESHRSWKLQFKYNNQGKWLSALEDLKDAANQNVRNLIKSRFEKLQATAIQKRDFQIEDLDAQIAVLITAHESETISRLAHLSEQAAIARKLNIPKQTGNATPSIYQSLNTQGSESIDVRTTNLENGSPLYLRGYIALEKEAELIKSRQDKRVFIDGLQKLEEKKLLLLTDKTVERAQRLFAKTPVMDPNTFRAAIFDVEATKFRYGSDSKLILTLTALVGGMIGVIYVLLANAMGNRRQSRIEQNSVISS